MNPLFHKPMAVLVLTPYVLLAESVIRTVLILFAVLVGPVFLAVVFALLEYKRLEGMAPKSDPNCDHEWHTVDDSFSHEYGTEVIVYKRCEKCGATENLDDEREW